MSLKSQIEESLSTTDEDIKSLLFNILNLNLQSGSNEKIIINAINKLLSVSKTRLQGLEYLNLVINNCSKTVIAENAFVWMSHCFIKYQEDNLKELKLLTIGNIVENIYGNQELTKRFIADYIAKVFESCISTHLNSHETEAALETLTICMKHHATWFTPHRSRIENFIITFLDHSTDNLVKKAAVAFLYLQQVGGAGVDGINHKTNFSTNFEKVCATTQNLFDKFFENETEIYDTNGSDQDGISFINLPLHSKKMLHITARRITNCLQFLRTMLQKSFPVAKDIKPTIILDVIGRGTAIHRCLTMDNENSLDFQFPLLLNKVQIQLLHLLRILILWLQTNALPFSYAITKILIDCLKKSQNCRCFTTDNLYQEVVYKVLGCWIRISKSSFHSHFQTQLITCIIKDITPIKDQVTLNLQSDTPKNDSLKAKNKFIKEKIISSGQGSNMLGKLTPMEKLNIEKKCILALDMLKQLQNATSLRLKPDILQDLYTTIMNPMMEMQISKFSHPYTNADCQAKLYEILVVFYEQDTLKVLPPLQLTLTILNRGINSGNRHIALTCEYGLSILEKLCQPVCPSLFSLDVSVISKDAIKKPKTLFSNHIFDKMFEDRIKENEQIEKDLVTNSDSLKQNIETSDAAKEADLDNEIEACVNEVMETINTDIENENNPVEMQEETNTDNRTQISQENVEGCDISSHTLLTENSEQIIEEQVVTTSSNDGGGDAVVNANDIADDGNNITDSTRSIPIPMVLKEEAEEDNLSPGIETESLKQGSIHIIDVQIVKTSNNDCNDDGADNDTSDSARNIPTPVELKEEDEVTASQENDNFSGEIDILKEDIFTDNSIRDENIMNESQTAEGEPPLKKCRIEENTGDVVEIEIKDELKNAEEIDDLFEEDGAFVDEVKEY